MKDAFYFPHFCNARHDRKLRRVRKELGLEGYGIFFMLLEVLREQADYKYPIEDIDLLADEFGTSEQKLRTVVTNYQLFEVDEMEKFFSSNLIQNLQPYLEGKKNKQISGIRGNLIRYKYISKEESNTMNPEEIMQKYLDLGMGSHSDNTAIPIKERKQRKGNKGKEIKVIHPLYKSINESFLSKNGGAYTNYPKEGKAINQLIVKCENRYPENTGDFIRALIEQYYKMVFSTDKFWSDQPFLPSTLNSSGIFDRVLKKLQVKDNQDIKIESLEGIQW